MELKRQTSRHIQTLPFTPNIKHQAPQRHMSVGEQADSVQTTPYQEAGERAGITRLVDEFYINMDACLRLKPSEACIPQDLTESRKKLTYFLCGWLGGPGYFSNIMGRSAFRDSTNSFPLDIEERDAWLLCMQRALAVQPYTTNSKTTS